jgi:hypothetical protein
VVEDENGRLLTSWWLASRQSKGENEETDRGRERQRSTEGRWERAEERAPNFHHLKIISSNFETITDLIFDEAKVLMNDAFTFQ